MARINIEEKWWTDPRRTKLGQLLGNPLFAESSAAMSWRLAQEYWEKGELIPGHIFVMLFGAMELLLSNLAQLRENKSPESGIVRTPLEHISTDSNTLRTHLNTIEQAYVYVRGSEEMLSWGKEIRQKRIAAGRKSAEKRRLLNGTAQPKSNKTRTQLEQASTKSNKPELSGSGSDSSSSSSSSSVSHGVAANKKFATPPFSSQIWDLYSREIEIKYNGRPERSAKTNSQIVTFLKQVPESEAIPLVRFYIEHPSSYYASQMHGIGPMVQDAGKLLLEMRSGQLAPERYRQNGKAPNGKWLTHDEKKRQNTMSAVDELCGEITADVGGGDLNG